MGWASHSVPSTEVHTVGAVSGAVPASPATRRPAASSLMSLSDAVSSMGRSRQRFPFDEVHRWPVSPPPTATRPFGPATMPKHIEPGVAFSFAGVHFAPFADDQTAAVRSGELVGSGPAKVQGPIRRLRESLPRRRRRGPCPSCCASRSIGPTGAEDPPRRLAAAADGLAATSGAGDGDSAPVAMDASNRLVTTARERLESGLRIVNTPVPPAGPAGTGRWAHATPRRSRGQSLSAPARPNTTSRPSRRPPSPARRRGGGRSLGGENRDLPRWVGGTVNWSAGCEGGYAATATASSSSISTSSSSSSASASKSSASSGSRPISSACVSRAWAAVSAA